VHGSEKITVNSSADWGPSDPLACHKTALELLRRGHDDTLITRVFHDNPCRFLGQSPRWPHQPILG
jgi:predicted metal-dependent TIM-barrel fold hydrolase